jgi:aryl-alcohol dehydrogenase-like predicted oxidoreductase
VKDHGLATFRRQLPETIERLDRYLDLYQVHSATLDSGVLDDPDTLRALAELHEREVAVGFSTSGPRQGDVIRRALDVEVDGQRVFDVVQTTWNVLEPSAGPALAEASDAGLGVIVKEALANGRLTDRNRTDPATRDALQRAAPGPSLDAIALAAALRQGWADVVLSGAATVEHLASNLAALDVVEALDVVDELEVESLGALAEPAEDYWRTRSALPWN